MNTLACRITVHSFSRVLFTWVSILVQVQDDLFEGLYDAVEKRNAPACVLHGRADSRDYLNHPVDGVVMTHAHLQIDNHASSVTGKSEMLWSVLCGLSCNISELPGHHR